MPCYVYKRPDGTQVERVFPGVPPENKRRRVVCDDGMVATRDIGSEQSRTCPAAYPRRSVGCGVRPDQVDEERRRNPHHKFAPNGDMIFESPAHEKRCMKDLGMVNFKDFYA